MSYEGNEEFSFRFGSLTESQVQALKEHCGSIEVGVRSRKNMPGRFCAWFRLDPANRHDWLQSFVRDNKIADSEYEVFVSLVTRYDSEIVTVPDYVLELHRRVGGGMDFSFTVISGSGEDSSDSSTDANASSSGPKQ